MASREDQGYHCHGLRVVAAQDDGAAKKPGIVHLKTVNGKAMRRGKYTIATIKGHFRTSLHFFQ